MLLMSLMVIQDGNRWDLTDYLCWLIILSFIIGPLYLLNRSIREKMQAQKGGWHKFATTLGLTYERGRKSVSSFGKMTGTYKGRKLKIDTVKKTVSAGEYGTDTVENMHFTMYVKNKTGGFFNLERKGLFSGSSTFIKRKLSGLQQIQIGDPIFDRKFSILSDTKEIAPLGLASVSLRNRLIKVEGLIHGRLRGQELSFTKNGLDADIGRLRSLVDLLYDFAEAVDKQNFEEQLVSIYDLAQDLGENPSTISHWCQNLYISSKYLSVDQAELIRNYRIMILEGLEVK
jgi:hypothetical protein